MTLVFANPLLASGRRRLPLDQEEVRMTRAVRLSKSNNTITTYLLDGEESTQKAFPVFLAQQMLDQMDTTSFSKVTSPNWQK